MASVFFLRGQLINIIFKKKYLYGDEVIKVDQEYFKTITLIRKHRVSVSETWNDLRKSLKKKKISLTKSFYVHDQIDEAKFINFILEVNKEK